VFTSAQSFAKTSRVNVADFSGVDFATIHHPWLASSGTHVLPKRSVISSAARPH
jgi:hypothetical protein